MNFDRDLMNCLIGLVVASATAEQVVLGSIPESDPKVLLIFSSRDFSITVTQSGFEGNRLAPYYIEFKK